jgi:hypothetical protein
VEGLDVSCSQGEQYLELCQFCFCGSHENILVVLDLNEVKEAKDQRIILDGGKDAPYSILGLRRRQPKRCGMHLRTYLRRRMKTRRWP